jgi:predicted 2-oxoglutarate/Fe(II)-dependent dioxygenase YbiX
MKTNLNDYILVFKQVIPEHIRETSLVELKSLQWTDNTYMEEQTVYEKDIQYTETRLGTTEQICSIEKTCVDHYIKHIGFYWFSSYTGIDLPRYNKTATGKEIRQHSDLTHNITDLTHPALLSVVGLLNDDFKGGEFIICDDLNMNLEAGDIIIFPSQFLYPHRVNEVTEGTRYSFASWVY